MTTAEIQYTSPGTIDLGPDTAVCFPAPVTLTPGPGYASYLWSNGSAGPSVAVTGQGTYWVQVTDPGGCVLSDTITVVGNSTPPNVDLGPDGTIAWVAWWSLMPDQEP
ncbi:MAG: hypothetical protein IPN62_03680 [Flavobacteriales bacterium]|nr:hypothetical protein [Flavobacteriales bacterium]